MNAVFELLQWAYGMNGECYRLLLFRYTFVIAFGCYLNLPEQKISKGLYAGAFIIGVLFILAYCYWGYQPVVIVHWTRTSFVGSLYLLPIAAVLIKKCTWKFAPLELLGKASFNIFLAQMVYYQCASRFVYAHVQSRPLQLLIGVVASVVFGLVFYWLETPLTKFLVKKSEDFFAKKTE